MAERGGFEPPGPFRIRGGIQSDFGALFGSNKSIRAGEILFAWNSALLWIYRFASFARLTRKIYDVEHQTKVWEFESPF